MPKVAAASASPGELADSATQPSQAKNHDAQPEHTIRYMGIHQKTYLVYVVFHDPSRADSLLTVLDPRCI